MEQIAAWVAPAATIVAAMMTAANLGTRITGWGFVIFTLASVGWSIIGFASGQTNLVLSNGFLILVNIVGVWRWLGLKAKHEDGSKFAAQRSAAVRHVPTLFSAGGLIGAAVTGRDGQNLGSVVDAMLRCNDATIAYVVLSNARSTGLAKTLHALDPSRLRFGQDRITADYSQADISGLPELASNEWPASLPR